MEKLIGTVKLRNLRRIYQLSGGFRVIHVDGKGVEHSYVFNEKVIDTLYRVCHKDTVTPEEAAFRLQPKAKDLGLLYHYGWKLKFLVQEMLLVLVILGRCVIEKHGNKYIYRIK